MPTTNTLPFTSKIIPVVELQSAEDAVPLADALLAGGIDVIEVTLRTDAALPAMERLSAERPALKVAAGTVTKPEQLRALPGIGVTMAFSPGCTATLLEVALAGSVRFFPGVLTPTEMMAAMQAGFPIMKLFPANAVNSLKMLKSISGPLPTARFIPTGGINETNVHDYTVQPNVLAMGASAVAPKALIAQKNWAAITEKARLLVDLTKTTR